jgi:hypothetical protein
LVDDERGLSTVRDDAGTPISTMGFDPVPEPEVTSNRVRWTVELDALEPPLADGASVLRAIATLSRAGANAPRAGGGETGPILLADLEGDETLC